MASELPPAGATRRLLVSGSARGRRTRTRARRRSSSARSRGGKVSKDSLRRLIPTNRLTPGQRPSTSSAALDRWGMPRRAEPLRSCVSGTGPSSRRSEKRRHGGCEGICRPAFRSSLFRRVSCRGASLEFSDTLSAGRPGDSRRLSANCRLSFVPLTASAAYAPDCVESS